MRIYHTPQIFRFFFNRHAVWQIPAKEKILYLTFDDGPTEELTTWILEMLKKYNAKATFFCVGENVEKHPDIFREISKNGHATGNHTLNHYNGWATENSEYLDNIIKASQLIPGNLFRPPYGKMSPGQIKKVCKSGYKIFMWSVLTYDFDKKAGIDKSWEKIVKFSCPGAIIVFHDNIKAKENLKFLLPKTLEYFGRLGYTFEAIK